jgi:hypothetical protein
VNSPIEQSLKEAWKAFREYAKREMGYANQQNVNECLNGAGAFVDFLLGEKPMAGKSYASAKDWPR